MFEASTDRKTKQMYTLKIRWYRYDFENGGKCVDETTLFLLTNSVEVHGEVLSMDEMSAWKEGDFFDKRSIIKPDGSFKAKLIGCEHNGKTCWYLASHAWLIGPEGKTIENLVPQ